MQRKNIHPLIVINHNELFTSFFLYFMFLLTFITLLFILSPFSCIPFFFTRLVFSLWSAFRSTSIHLFPFIFILLFFNLLCSLVFFLPVISVLHLFLTMLIFPLLLYAYVIGSKLWNMVNIQPLMQNMRQTPPFGNPFLQVSGFLLTPPSIPPMTSTVQPASTTIIFGVMGTLENCVNIYALLIEDCYFCSLFVLRFFLTVDVFAFSFFCWIYWVVIFLESYSLVWYFS